MSTIEIVISPSGQSTVQTRGFSGSSCRDASRFIEQAIGRPTGERLTAEFRQVQPIQENQHQRA